MSLSVSHLPDKEISDLSLSLRLMFLLKMSELE